MDASTARAIIDASSYLTLATADGAGRPWASPVWFAHRDFTDIVWGSKPGARHSQNLTVRPDVAIVLFDSSGRPGETIGVYLECDAGLVPDADLDDWLAVYSARSVAQGMGPWERSRLTGTAVHRLYRATVRQAYILDDHDERLAIELGETA